jgi:hypothetical protein
MVVRMGMLRMDANPEEGYRESTEHPEPDAGKRVPTQINRAQADGKGPEQGGGLKDVEHDLAFHNLPRF